MPSQQRTYTNFSGGQNNQQGPQAGPVVVDKGDGTEALLYAHASANWDMSEDGLIKYAGFTSIITDTLLTGTVSFNSSGTALTGSGTLFNTELHVGDVIKMTTNTGLTAWIHITAITNDTAATATTILGIDAAGAELSAYAFAGATAYLDSIATGPVTTGEFDWNGQHILCAGGKVYTVAGGTLTQIYTGHTAGKYYQFTEWDDGTGTEILIMCNGYDVPLYYDGVTCTTITFNDPDTIWDDATPQGAMIFRGSIFYWGDPTHPHRIYKPIPGSFNDFDNSDFTVEAFDVDAGFGGALTGLKALTDDLAIIYKERAIRRMSGVNPFGSDVDPISYAPVSDQFGCIAPRTLVQIALDQYFLSEDGLRKLKPIQSFGDLDPQQPTYPIQQIINDLNFTDTVIVNACAVFHKNSNKYWLSVPRGASSTNNQIIIYDVITQGSDLREQDDIEASVLALVDNKVHHGNYTGQIYRHGDSYSYRGMAIDAEWESKWIAHDGIGYLKCYRELHIFAESEGNGTFVCQYAVLDLGVEVNNSSTEQIQSGGDTWDAGLWNTAEWDSGQVNVFKIMDLGLGNALKLRFINEEDAQVIKIRQVDLHYDVFGTAKG